MRIVNETSSFEAVFDFSAYEPKWVHDAIDILKSKSVGVYMYVSSDAVYEVSVPKSSKRLSVETDAKRPHDLKVRQAMNKNEPYGNAKLAGEEALADQSHFPWVSFRFADVIGPRDNTRRFSYYHTWFKFYDDIQVPFHLPHKVKDVEESITFVDDSADAMIQALKLGPGVWNEAYNIASTPALHTLGSLVETMTAYMNVTIDETDPNDDNLYMYPTVFSGGMNIQKAIEKLGYSPTDVDDAVRSTIDWYDNEFANQFDYREEMISEMMARVVPRERRDQVYLAVDRELSRHGVNVAEYKSKRKGDLEYLAQFDKPDFKKLLQKDEL